MGLPVFRRRAAVRRPSRPIGFETCERRQVMSGTGLLPTYDTGTPDVIDLWVDPVAGSDARGGDSRSDALRTLTAAWQRVPVRTPLSQGVRINLVAGTYPESAVPRFWESRHGTFAAPVIVRAVDGPGTARLPALNIFDCRHLQLVGLEVTAGGGDVVQVQASSHVLLRHTTIRGTGDLASYAVPQEALKVNQSQHVYIEHCDISGAWDNAVDFVAVQYGHVVGSRIHRAGDWAMYAKGGSAYLTITGNEFFDAGTGGFTAGQGTGFEFMVAPWIHYEAYDIAFTNNVVRNVQGAGFGVNGGYNVLFAHNTLYDVGARSHVIEVVHGLRSCDGDEARCAALQAAGGWGPAVAGREEPIPNKNVVIVNNVVVNPDGRASRWQHFAVHAPRTPRAGTNIPSPARADDGLVIRGNVIWNGPATHALGIDDPSLAAAVLAFNAINTVRPVLVDPARGNFRLAAAPALPGAVPIPDFGWADAPTRPAVPAGRISGAVSFDHVGLVRTGPQAPGAFTGGSVGTPTPEPPQPPPEVVPPPRIVRLTLPAARTYRSGATLTFTVRFDAPVTVTGRPRLPLVIGGVERFATYASGSGSRVLTFRYRVPSRDAARGSLALGAALDLPAGTLVTDARGAAVLLGLPPATLGRITVRPTRR